MREAGRVVAHALEAVRAAVRPGVSLRELDALGEETIREEGATPSFLGYHPHFAPSPFPGTLCLSPNNVIVHGIPDRYRLREGDLLSIDCGAVVDGYHGDAAVTVPVGEVVHEDPSVLNDGRPGRGLRLREGLVLAIEPMFNEGGGAYTVKPDGWALITRDGSRSAHFEHTVAITATGPRVLTLP